MFWHGLALGICIGLAIGAFIWTFLALHRMHRELEDTMPEEWVRRLYERAGR